jgi:acyl-CoA synthetase (AMP-forming)/AMP-acid ligase II
VMDYCSGQLADYKIPQYITVVPDALPRNAGGKLLKGKLRQQMRWGAALR